MAQFPWSQAPDPKDLVATKRFFDDIIQLVKLLQVFGSDRVIIAGSGTPEGVITARVGSLFLRTDAATSLYVKQTGDNTNTGWVAK